MKEKIISLLKDLSLSSMHSGEPWRSFSYARAVEELGKQDESFFNEQMDFTFLPGIGTSINAKINEFIQTQNITRVREVKSDIKPTFKKA